MCRRARRLLAFDALTCRAVRSYLGRIVVCRCSSRVCRVIPKAPMLHTAMQSHAGVTRQCLVAGREAFGNLHRSSRNGQRVSGRNAFSSGHTRRSAGHVSTSFTAPGAAQPSTTATAPASESTTFKLACPICTDTSFELGGDRSAHDALSCARCARTFNTDQTSEIVDLTLTSGVTSRVYKESMWGGVEIFRNPLVSFVYERGWRQGFAWAGFPGVEKEFEMAMRLLRPAFGKVLVDMSCGSGVFSRQFAASRQFSGLIAADYSETMLQQTQRTFSEEGFPSDGSVLLLRADVGRLPFATGSVAAIHAGAAIHCWPNPTAALAEISRVLEPGGVFVASTFLKAAAPLGQLLGDENVRLLNRFDPSSSGSGRSYRWWEEAELRDLTTTVGLEDFQRERRFRFIMFSAKKPGAMARSS